MGPQAVKHTGVVSGVRHKTPSSPGAVLQIFDTVNWKLKPLADKKNDPDMNQLDLTLNLCARRKLLSKTAIIYFFYISSLK